MTSLSDQLRELADDEVLMWEVAREAIEDVLVDLRDSRISLSGRNNGLVIKEKDGSESHMIRLGPEMAVSTALRAIADHLEKDGE